MTFKISKEAENDLRKIARYTQDNWGREQRRKYLSDLNNKFDFLSKIHSLPANGKNLIRLSGYTITNIT